MRSLRIGLRLWGMAELPFWPLAKFSSTSSTSVRCKLRISVEKRSREVPTSARVCTYSAWRSRPITWVLAVSGSRPSSRQVIASTWGSVLA